MNDTEPLKNLLKEMAGKIDAEARELNIQGPKGMMMMSTHGEMKLKDVIDCPVISFKLRAHHLGKF